MAKNNIEKINNQQKTLIKNSQNTANLHGNSRQVNQIKIYTERDISRH